MEEITCYFILFIIYSFIGWLYETILCSTRERSFINRGFINGPFCPIYGSGALIVVIILGDINNPFIVFFLGVLLTGVLEYLTSYIMEKLFHARWWDYTERRFNINGRVCLLGAFIFGWMSLLVVFIVNPLLLYYLAELDARFLGILALLIIIGIAIDFSLTVNSFLNLNERLSNVQNVIIEESKMRKNELRDSFVEIIEEGEIYSEKIKNMINIKSLQDRRIIKAFPHLISTKYYEAFEKFKEIMKKNIK